MRTIAIVNQKGGSGKTTTAINLAAVLARRGQRVLLIDLDPQGHCGLGLAIPENEIAAQIGDAMAEINVRPPDRERLIWNVSRNLDLAPSSARLAALEAPRGGLADREDRDLRLQRVIDAFAGQYDWFIVDCSPSIGLLTFNALRAATEVLIPVETSFFAMQGAARQIRTIRALGRRFGMETPYRVLPTLHDPDSTLAADVIGEIQRRYDECAIPVVIRSDVRLREAASFGLPIIEYAPRSVGAADYQALASWILENPVAPTPISPESLTMEDFESDAFGDPEHVCHTPAEDEGSDADDCAAAAPTRVVAAPATGARLRAAQPVNAEPETDNGLSPMNRAAELAARARRIATRGERIEQRLSRDPAVAKVMAELEQRQTDAQPDDPAIRRHFGVHPCAGGLLFVQPGSPRQQIFVAGDHNEWVPSRSPMRYNPEVGVHELRLELPVGKFAYRIVVDGTWKTDPYNPREEPNPYGSVNSIAIVGERSRTAATDTV